MNCPLKVFVAGIWFESIYLLSEKRWHMLKYANINECISSWRTVAAYSYIIILEFHMVTFKMWRIWLDMFKCTLKNVPKKIIVSILKGIQMFIFKAFTKIWGTNGQNGIWKHKSKKIKINCLYLRKKNWSLVL